MRRLNVRQDQIEECIRLSMFAVDMLPANPALRQGEELLLQLVLEDARKLGLEAKRIQFALLFDRVEPDRHGEVSRRTWPKAGKAWKYIIYCTETVPTLPFSLEQLNLSKEYGGQINPMYIPPEDEARIRPYVKDGMPLEPLTSFTSVDALLTAVRNHDTVVKLSPVRTTQVAEHERRLADPWLGNTLKSLYEHRCQICLHDFNPRYGVAYADTRFILPPEKGGEPISRNVVVTCPNHNAIIGAAGAKFKRHSLAFQFPNGLVEKLTLRDHLLP